MNDKGAKWRFSYQISGALQDPFLLVEFANEGKVILFDCGVRIWGRVKTILKIQHLFITHAHIDHLIGFDHIIRSLLGEDSHLKIYGPKGILARLSSKLNGYDWDRAADQALVLEIHELDDQTRTIQIFRCRDRFIPTSSPRKADWDGIVVEEPLYRVKATEMDHGGAPCLAYLLEEKDYYKIDKKRLDEINGQPGPWVGRLLKWAASDQAEDVLLTINQKEYSAKALEKMLVRRVPGHRIAYVTDTIYSTAVRKKLRSLIYKADILFCESTFMDEDEALARRYHHMTSTQAARLAAENHVRKLVLFHISNRYVPQLYRLIKEARKIFPNTELAPTSNRLRQVNRRQQRSHDTE